MKVAQKVTKIKAASFNYYKLSKSRSVSGVIFSFVLQQNQTQSLSAVVFP